MSDRGVKWDAKTHTEEELWVCPSCDAHLHVDCVGDKCPACGEPIEDTPHD
jgi:rubrerythrin